MSRFLTLFSVVIALVGCSRPAAEPATPDIQPEPQPIPARGLDCAGVVPPDELKFPIEDPEPELKLTNDDPEPPPPPAVSAFPNRSGATKSRLAREGGCNEESERAVAMGLAWLARMQKQDGGWEFDSGDRADRIAATGLALLPFLAAGETHMKGKKYQKTVNMGLQFLLRNCPMTGRNAGRLSENSYSHAIATLALCEAYGMTKDKALLLAPSQAAVNYVVRTQNENGSWPAPNTFPDGSLIGWQLQALHAARVSKDIVVAQPTIKKAIEFLDKTGAGENKSAYGRKDDTDAAPGTTHTAIGLLSRVFIDGWDADNGSFGEGIKGLMAKAPGGNAKEPPTLDANFHFHATQVVRLSRSEAWKVWNEGPKPAEGARSGGLRDWLIALQIKKDGPNQGSFDPDSGSVGKNYGRLGTTAMCLLTLQVYYRNLPVMKPKVDEGK